MATRIALIGIRTPRLCSIQGCYRTAYARTWCFMHYQRHWRHGTTDGHPEGALHNSLKTHCAQGHPYNQANTRWRQVGGRWRRECRTCKRRWDADRAARRKPVVLTRLS